MTYPVGHTQKHYTVVNSISPWAKESEGEKIWSSKTERGGGSVFKFLFNSHFGLSNPSHILALVYPSQPLHCLQSICFVCVLQHIILSLTLLSDSPLSPLSGSHWTSNVLASYLLPGFSSISLFLDRVAFLSGSLDLCETLGWPQDLESSIHCLYTLGGRVHIPSHNNSNKRS